MAMSDITLMDVITGLFARFEYLSPGRVSFETVGEFARLARRAVERSKMTDLDTMDNFNMEQSSSLSDGQSDSCNAANSASHWDGLVSKYNTNKTILRL